MCWVCWVCWVWKDGGGHGGSGGSGVAVGGGGRTMAGRTWMLAGRPAIRRRPGAGFTLGTLF